VETERVELRRVADRPGRDRQDGRSQQRDRRPERRPHRARAAMPHREGQRHQDDDRVGAGEDGQTGQQATEQRKAIPVCRAPMQQRRQERREHRDGEQRLGHHRAPDGYQGHVDRPQGGRHQARGPSPEQHRDGADQGDDRGADERLRDPRDVHPPRLRRTLHAGHPVDGGEEVRVPRRPERGRPAVGDAPRVTLADGDRLGVKLVVAGIVAEVVAGGRVDVEQPQHERQRHQRAERRAGQQPPPGQARRHDVIRRRRPGATRHAPRSPPGPAGRPAAAAAPTGRAGADRARTARAP